MLFSIVAVMLGTGFGNFHTVALITILPRLIFVFILIIYILIDPLLRMSSTLITFVT